MSLHSSNDKEDEETSKTNQRNVQGTIEELLNIKGKSQEKVSKSNEKIALIYFDKRANCECIRFLLAYGKINFEDIRITKNEWDEFKPKTQFGNLPILYMNGMEMDKTIPICRYLGNIIGLTGHGPIENLHIDRIVEHFNDLRLVVSEYNMEVPCSKKKAELDFKLQTDSIPFYFERFDRLAEGGYIANGKLSWADLYLVAFLDYVKDVLQSPLLNNYPNLIALCRRIHMLPAIREWIAKRPYSLY